MKLLELSQKDQQTILSSYQPIDDWQTVGPFCVDGRDGWVKYGNTEAKQHLFVQALGGSLLIAVIRYLRDGGDFNSVLDDSITKLQAHGYGVGVHRGSHAHDDASDCGFADNLQTIIARLADEQSQIYELIMQAAPSVADDAIWEAVVNSAKQVSQTPVPSGESFIKQAHRRGANLQTLDGDHAELAAVVNLSSDTTLNTGQLVSDGKQAFNLDLWYVLKQAELLEIDSSFATLASLGLYIATEMVLVEDKKHIRLPILIHS